MRYFSQQGQHKVLKLARQREIFMIGMRIMTQKITIITMINITIMIITMTKMKIISIMRKMRMTLIN